MVPHASKHYKLRLILILIYTSSSILAKISLLPHTKLLLGNRHYYLPLLYNLKLRYLSPYIGLIKIY